MKVIIQTERLILREIVPTDAKHIFELDSDPLVLSYLGQSPISKIEQAEETIAYIRKQYSDNGIGRWAIEEIETGRFIGWAGFKFITDTVNNHINYFDLGYRLIRRYWGKGFASEASFSCVKYGFEKLMMPEIFAIANISNSASVKILERVGFNRIETFTFQNEQHYWFTLKKQEWTP